jgi:hypothetical protein
VKRISTFHNLAEKTFYFDISGIEVAHQMPVRDLIRIELVVMQHLVEHNALVASRPSIIRSEVLETAKPFAVLTSRLSFLDGARSSPHSFVFGFEWGDTADDSNV